MTERANQPSLAHRMQSAGVSQDRRIAGRFFLVGCPRSGTTLLQAMLASHSRVFSPPETHFFRRASGNRWRHRVLGQAPLRAYRVLADVLDLLKREDLKATIPRYRPFFRSYGRAFSNILDQVTIEHGRDIWVEKTPRHLFHIPQIERTVPCARFIHILRDGRDVVASIYGLCLQAPEIWIPQVLPGAWQTHFETERKDRHILEAVIQRWNSDVRLSLRRLNDGQHIMVSYENLLANTAVQLARVCDFMQIEFEPEMLHYQEVAAEVVGWRVRSPWMRKPFEPLEDTRLGKFTRIFTEEEQRRITGRLLYGGDIGNALDGSLTHADTVLCRNAL